MKKWLFKEEKESLYEPSIYFDKSALVLDWLLNEGLKSKLFSIREVARDCNVSLGQVHKVFKVLVMHGYLGQEGVRTSKRFYVKRADLILNNWLEKYSIVQKCKMWSFRSALQGREELLTVLKKSKLDNAVALALHSAAESLGLSNTNLNTLELYVLKPQIIKKLIKVLQLEPQEKGYEVLLIEPYYKSFLKARESKSASVVLTFLDLYHFPLRGREQAEYMLKRDPHLKSIMHKG